MTSVEYDWRLHSSRVIFRVSTASDRGRVRRVNEDSFVAVPPIFLVADGMGGHAFGDRASQATARLLETKLGADAPVPPSSVLAAVDEANELVQSIGDEEFAGTTLAGVALVQDADSDEPYWMAFNIGDSRIYRLTGDGIVQLSVDHSAVQELLDQGAISPAEASSHPERNVVTRAIGIDGGLGPDVWLFAGGGEQNFLICSDGLTKELDDEAIWSVLAARRPEESPAELLVAAALAAGGADNVTVVVVESVSSRISVGRGKSAAIPARLEETVPRPGDAS